MNSAGYCLPTDTVLRAPVPLRNSAESTLDSACRGCCDRENFLLPMLNNKESKTNQGLAEYRLWLLLNHN
jgi:hypothetical protein